MIKFEDKAKRRTNPMKSQQARIKDLPGRVTWLEA